AGDNAPGAAIPMQGQSLCIARDRLLIITNRPNVAAADRRNTIETTITGAWHRDRNDAPTGPVPVFEECVTGVALPGPAHHPHIIRPGSGDAVEEVVIRIGVRAGTDAPLGAVPVFDQGLVVAAGISVVARRPDVGGCECRNAP